MSNNRRINASELDFNELKANLISYMQEQPGAFQDYNFEGAAMNTMIDVLSYITHINSINANFALNETFLDTAQLRESVVSHAKLLGYTPRSTKPSIAVVNIEMVAPTESASVESSLIYEIFTAKNAFAAYLISSAVSISLITTGVSSR